MNTASIPLRLLTIDDAADFVAIRRLALSTDQAAFSARAATDAWSKLESARERFSTASAADGPIILGAHHAGLVGVIGLLRSAPDATRIWGLYVKPDQRGSGLGRALVQGAIDVARRMPGVVRVELGVDDSCTAARHLYAQSGFRETRFKVATGGHEMILELTSPKE